MNFTLPTTQGPFTYPQDLNQGGGLLFYYGGDFCPVAATELMALASLAGDFEREGCSLLCISADSIPCHLAFL